MKSPEARILHLRRRAWCLIWLSLGGLLAAAAPAGAQTDYYNLDAERPLRIEDASAVEYRALELQLAPVLLERTREGSYWWTLKPHLTAGLLPRTQIGVGVPVMYVDGAGYSSGGLAGVELKVLHNLNIETTLPAMAIAADVLIPAGHLGPARAVTSVKGIVTRTFPWARLHVNGRYTFGDAIDTAVADAGHPHEPGGRAVEAELSRWMAGLGVDRALPLRSMLIGADVVAKQPLVEGDPLEWSSAAGFRYQVSPYVISDAGAGYRFTGSHTGWFVTGGVAFTIGLPWRR